MLDCKQQLLVLSIKEVKFEFKLQSNLNESWLKHLNQDLDPLHYHISFSLTCQEPTECDSLYSDFPQTHYHQREFLDFIRLVLFLSFFSCALLLFLSTFFALLPLISQQISLIASLYTLQPLTFLFSFSIFLPHLNLFKSEL